MDRAALVVIQAMEHQVSRDIPVLAVIPQHLASQVIADFLDILVVQDLVVILDYSVEIVNYSILMTLFKILLMQMDTWEAMLLLAA